MRMLAWFVCAMLAGPLLAGATGRVIDPDGAPISGAEVCEFSDGVALRCVKVDARGSYTMENPVRPTVLVRASGFVARTIEAAPLSEPVRLQRAAALAVRVVDAVSGQPLPSGKVMIDLPSGRRIGDFVPFNKGGVRISTLDPGMVFVRATADGYEAGGPMPIELVGGAEQSVRIPMTKSHGAER